MSLNAEKEFLRIFNQITWRHSPWEVWKDFVSMFACSLSNAVDKTYYDKRETIYMITIRKYVKSEQVLFPELVAQTVMALEENPEQDFLGKIFMALNLGSDAKGQFFTPYDVCDLMARISMEDVASEVEEKGYISISDSCCGAGATLIAGVHEARRKLEKVNLNWQNHVLVVAQDVDYTVALMCYIQLSLLGAAGYVKIGNSLTEPLLQNDDLEGYWFTPMHFSQVWVGRRLFRRIELL